MRRNITGLGRHGISLGLLLAGATAVSGCWFEKFDVLPSEGGSGGSASGGGDMGGAPGSGGGNASGGSGNGAITATADTFQASQTVSVTGNVLENDIGTGLQIDSFSDKDSARPGTLSAVSFNIAKDGTLTYEPAAGFWGEYKASYTVKDADGNTATGSVSIQVSPREIDLAFVDQGHAGFVLNGQAGEELGTRIAAAGDVNNDGFDDLLISAPKGNASKGRVALLLGGAGLPSTLTIDDSTSSDHVQLYLGTGATNETPLGVSVSGAGNVNGDKFGDIVLGATVAGDQGRAYVLYGSANLPSPPITVSGAPASAQGHTLSLTSITNPTRFAFVVGGGADLNGDGTDDVLAYSADATRLNVYFSPLTAADNPDLLYQDTIDQAGVLIGDIFGDGKGNLLTATSTAFKLVRGTASPDCAASASSPCVNADSENAAFTVNTGARPNLGPSMANARFFEGSGNSSLVYCNASDRCLIVPPAAVADYSLAAGWTIQIGSSTNPRTGGAPPFVSGDTNGDGLDDLVFAQDSTAYLVFGQQSMPTGTLNVSTLTQDNAKGEGATILQSGGTFGRVAVIGDINGDGRADYALAMPTANASAGKVYVLYGY